MSRRLLVATAGAGVLVGSLASVPVAGQSSSRNTHWSAPRTLWGDPDLQGNYTNKYEQGTPFERPAQFDGRSLDSFSAAETAEIIAKRQQQAIERAPFLGGDPEGRIGGPAEFRDNNEIVKGASLWFVVDPPDGHIPPMTPAAQQRIARIRRGGSSFSNGPFSGPEDLSLYDRCITRGYPGSMLPAIYGDSYQIIQGPGYVAIRYEMIHETRVIPLTPRPRLSPKVRMFMGDPRGHFEGNTLVVETVNFTDRTALGVNGGGVRHSEKLKLTERFTPMARDKMEWKVTVEDPDTWVKPWTFALTLTKDASQPVFEYGCHEGNYAIRNILSAARAEEKR